MFKPEAGSTLVHGARLAARHSSIRLPCQSQSFRDAEGCRPSQAWAPLKKIQDQKDQSDHKQQMNQSASRKGADHSQQPEHGEDNDDRLNHGVQIERDVLMRMVDLQSREVSTSTRSVDPIHQSPRGPMGLAGYGTGTLLKLHFRFHQRSLNLRGFSLQLLSQVTSQFPCRGLQPAFGLLDLGVPFGCHFVRPSWNRGRAGCPAVGPWLRSNQVFVA